MYYSDEFKGFKILTDEVSKSDLFKNNTHQQLADVIADIICNEENSLTIGLEGEYGTGKSTVIKLLENKLDCEKNTKTIIFDSWVHEGDPLRRSFLESMITQLKIDNKNIEDDLIKISNKISNKEKTIKSSSKQGMNTLGKFISIAMFLVPLGVALTTINCSIFSIMLTIAPIFVLFFNLFRLIWKNYKTKKPKDSFAILFKMKKEDWTFLANESIQDITQDISEEIEKTSIDFEDYFKDIMGVYFSNKNKSKVVLVIDNLDRIDNKEALKVLSTLQVFIEIKNNSSDLYKWINNLWIIIPYDPKGLNKLWDKEENLSKNFIEKIFQIRFEVPMQVLTDWKIYLIAMIDRAIPNIGEESRKEIINILSITRKGEYDIPTPREIKNFINYIIVVNLSNDYNLKFRNIVYYAYLKKFKQLTSNSIRKLIIDGKLIEDNLNGFL